MQIPMLATLLKALELPDLPSSSRGVRSLQFTLPDYTSPPLPEAINATPVAYQSDETIDAARSLDADGKCVGDQAKDNTEACQIKFGSEFNESSTGVLFFSGALVDPRGYSPLMAMISDAYNLPISVPIFDGDTSYKFGTCESGRLAQAQFAFPSVEKWIFIGHSLGGVTAFNDVWAMAGRNETDAIGGLVLLASYVRQDLGCGATDFSGDEWSWLPVASISASEDGVANATNFAAGQAFLPSHSPRFINETIEGGNHGGFGSYDDSERYELLGQIDGNASITNEEQQRQTTIIIGEIEEMASSLIEVEKSEAPIMQESPTDTESNDENDESSNLSSSNDATNAAGSLDGFLMYMCLFVSVSLFVL